MPGNRRLTIEILGDAKGVGQAFGQAEAGASQLGSGLDDTGKKAGLFGSAMGTAAVAGAAALGAFAIKGVQAFQDTAKAALDLSKQSGLTVEEASRWTAVGDDFQVSGEQIGSALGKITKSLDDKKWTKYGIATRDAGGHALKTNDIFLDSLDALSRIKNPTEQAAAGVELFGKSYENIAPMIGKTRAEYQQMLSTVEEGQVITDKEAARSEKWRMAQDKLSDAFGELALGIGEVVAGFAPLLEVVAKAVGWIGKFLSVMTEGARSVQAMTDEQVQAALATDDATAALQDMGYSTKEATILIANYKERQREAAAASNSSAQEMEHVGVEAHDMAAAIDTAESSTSTLAYSTERAKRAADDMKNAWSAMKGELDERQAFLNIQDDVDNLREKLMLAWDAGATNAADAEAKARDYENALVDTKQGVIDYGKEIGLLPTEVQTLLDLADNGQIDEMERRLAILTRNRTMQVSLDLKGAVGTFKVYGSLERAMGGPTWPGQIFEVAEGGRPEMYREGGRSYLIPGGSGMVTPFSDVSNMPAAGGAGGMTVVVNVGGSVVSERDLVRSVYDGIIDGQRRGELVGTIS